MDFESVLEERSAEIDRVLGDLLPPAETYPSSLHQAIRYSVFAGGKRFRPVLALEICEALGGDPSLCLVPAACIELVHVSSLIHDDLPCMDDADFRRGKPSSHKTFGEALAVLAGDWLLTFPFQVLSQPSPTVEARFRIIHELARSIGSFGIVAGQVVDLEAETAPTDPDTVRYLNIFKTGALIEAAARIGAIVAGADPQTLSTVTDFGALVGLAFQVADDILDAIGDAAVIGKPVGADAEHQKQTFVSVHGLDGARRLASEMARDAHAKLREFPHLNRTATLAALVDFVIERAY